MASGLIEEGGSATATRPGVNELRVEGNKPNPQDAQRILQSIRDAKKRADLVIVYEHNHVFDKPFRTIMLEELPERLAPPDWLKKWTHDGNRRRRGYHRDAWRASPARCRDLSRPAYLLRSGQFHFSGAADGDIARRTDRLGKRGRLCRLPGKDAAIHQVPADLAE